MIQNIGIEIKYGFRSGKLLILLACFLFFALLTPLMLKFILPGILESQGASSQDLSGLMNMTQAGCIHIYMNDVFEIGTIIVAFTLCGLLAQEIRDNTLVLPLCSGKHFSNIVGAKLLIFGFALILISLAALMVNYLYAGLLFSFDVKIFPIIQAGILQGIYMNFLLACVILWGAVAKRPIPTGFLTLVTAFGLHFIGSLLGIHAWLPSGLLEQAQHLIESPESSMILTLTITNLLIFAMFALALVRLKNIEWNERQA
jgi:ABC-type transport system involved in multi-copper enzyme maturation permease subunit